MKNIRTFIQVEDMKQRIKVYVAVDDFVLIFRY
jgi:hypothetical protein